MHRAQRGETGVERRDRRDGCELVRADGDDETCDGSDPGPGFLEGADGRHQDVATRRRNREGLTGPERHGVLRSEPHAAGERERLFPSSRVGAFGFRQCAAGHAQRPRLELVVERGSESLSAIRRPLDERDARAQAAPLVEGNDVGRERFRRVGDRRRRRHDRESETGAVPINDDASLRAGPDLRDRLVAPVNVDSIGFERPHVVVGGGDRDRRVARRGDEREGEGRVARRRANGDARGGGAREGNRARRGATNTFADRIT